MATVKQKFAPDYRDSPSPTYQEIIAADARPAGGVFKEYSEVDIPISSVPKARYTSAAFAEREIGSMWPFVWQLACHRDQIPEAGDVHVYESPGASLIIVRGDDNRIRAFYNSCRHRGMKLCVGDTSVPRLRCPFHAFTWNLDGSLYNIPAKWDFPQIERDDFGLVEVQVGEWGGFVFINRDAAAAPLAGFLGPLVRHFADWPMEDMYVETLMRKTFDANWKASIEGFLEGYHVAELHSHALAFGGEASMQYDIWPENENVSRFLAPNAVQSDQLKEQLTDQQIYDSMLRLVTGEKAAALPEGSGVRQVMADAARTFFTEQHGHDYSALSDTEAFDPHQYSIFPNIVIFRSLSFPYMYRFLPDAENPHRSIFEFFVFSRRPANGSAPPETRLVHMGPEDTYANVGVFPPWLGMVYDQDTEGLKRLQDGMRAGGDPEIRFSRYQESRLRFLHQTLMRYLDRHPSGLAA